MIKELDKVFIKSWGSIYFDEGEITLISRDKKRIHLLDGRGFSLRKNGVYAHIGFSMWQRVLVNPKTQHTLRLEEVMS